MDEIKVGAVLEDTLPTSIVLEVVFGGLLTFIGIMLSLEPLSSISLQSEVGSRPLCLLDHRPSFKVISRGEVPKAAAEKSG